MVLPVSSEISHWIGNENQDTVALLENFVDFDKKGDVLTGEINRPSTGRVEPVRGCLNNPSRLE